jgi:hypothetical protein
LRDFPQSVRSNQRQWRERRGFHHRGSRDNGEI